MSEPLYESELSDLKAISDAVGQFMRKTPALNVLYVDGIEVTVGMEGGSNHVFTVWWDGESECTRIERRNEVKP